MMQRLFKEYIHSEEGKVLLQNDQKRIERGGYVHVNVPSKK